MWRILDNLYLGDREDSRDLPLLRREGITHVVNCARELPCCFPADFCYLSVGLEDPDPNLCNRLDDVCRFIDAGRERGKVLVHCTAAVSRSPTVVLAYLCHLGRTLPQAIEELAGKVATAPDDSFLRQLCARYPAPR